MNEFLRANAAFSRPIGVDREANVIRGYVVAQEGPFKDLRGEFNHESLDSIVAKMKAAPNGLKSRFTHPGLSSDGLGKFLGRAKNPRIDEATAIRDGKQVKVAAVRADLHLSDSAFRTPNGDLGSYVLDLAEHEPDSFSSSLVIEPEMRKNNRLRADDDDEVPQIWLAKALHASDVVDTGDAVDGFLSVHPLKVQGLPDELAREAWVYLDAIMAGKNRDECAKLFAEQAEKYLAYRYGTEQRRLNPAVLRAKMRLREAAHANRVK